MSPAACDDESGPPGRLLVTSLTYWATAFFLLLVYAWSELNSAFFFDEAWRADVIRSARPLDQLNQLSGIAAPIPPLWLGILHVSSWVMPDGYASLRIQNLALAALFPALAGQLVRTLSLGRAWLADQRKERFLLGWLACAGAAAALDSLAVVEYFNDYPFQGALVLAFVLAWFYADHDWMPLAWMTPFLILLALGTISGLFILPVYALWLWRTRRTSPPYETWLPVLIAGALAAFMYSSLYRTQDNAGLHAYWSEHRLSNGAGSVAETLERLLRSIGSLAFPSPVIAKLGLVAGVLVLALAVVGLRELLLRWRWIVYAAIVSWAVAVVASIAVGWPVTAVRVNVPFLSLWILASFVGLCRIIVLCLSRVKWAIAPVLAVTVAGVVLVNVFIPRSHSPLHKSNASDVPFARGLDDDLDPIRNSQASQIVVVSYHFMSRPYVHDGLINGGPTDGRYEIVQEELGDPLAYSGLLAKVDGMNLVEGAEVWCIIPYDIGPDATEQACRLDDAQFVEIYNQRLSRAVVIGLRKITAPDD